MTTISADTSPHVAFSQKPRNTGQRWKSMSTATCDMQLPPDMKPAFTPLRRIGPVVEAGGSMPGSTGDVASRSGSFSSGRRKSMMDYDKPRGASSFQTYKKISGAPGPSSSTTVGPSGGSAQGSQAGESLEDTLAALDIGIGGYKSPRRGSAQTGQTSSPRVSESEKS